MRLIGIDLGEKRVGIAVSDPGGSIAFPHSVKPRNEILLSLKSILTDYPDCAGFVLGLPKTLRGEMGHAAQLTEAFAKELEVFEKPIHLWDERLSTRAVSGVGAPQKSIDALAAQFILQGYLDSQKSETT